MSTLVHPQATSMPLNRTSSRRRLIGIRRLMRRPWVAASLLACASLTTSIAISITNWPTPRIHDEFSYLLGADTFSEGRLANPTHPYWKHFETFHVIHEPTYASKYPPGQAAVLAAGQWLTDQPLTGVWILSALASCAIYWMLLGWTSPRGAMLGGLLYLANPAYQLVWGQSYWGGTLALLGGTLVFGAAARIVRRNRVIDAVAMASGASVLAFSRPFEGLVFCLLVGGWVIVRWSRDGLPTTWRGLILKTVAPQAIVLLAAGMALATYNRAVTGDPRIFPYMLHEKAYAQTPVFHGQASRALEYRHAVIEKFHSGWTMDWYRAHQTLPGWVSMKLKALKSTAANFAPLLVAAPLLWLLAARRSRQRARLTGPLVIVIGTLAISLVSVWNFPHYVAPVAPLVILMLVIGLQRADAFGRRRLGGFRLGEALVAMQIGVFLIAAASQALAAPNDWAAQRARISADLEQSPQRHLVFVRYSSEHNAHHEWVYNRADIDGSKIVWARQIDEDRDNQLMRYFSDRKVWVLEPDASKPTLRPLKN